MSATTLWAKTALRWAEAEMPVFPVGITKRPITDHGLLDATTDLAVVAGWWSKWPEANVAVRCGAPSGLVVLDADGDEGADSLFELEREHGELPATRSVVTPRDGQHFLFRWPGHEIKSSASRIAPKLDIRGDGGYALIPPSRTPAGSYEWDNAADPAPMPQWLIDMTAATSSTSTTTITPPEEWIAMLSAGISEGRRNTSLARLTGYLLRRYVDAHLVALQVHLTNAHRCRPPLPTAEVDRIIDSVSACELRRRRNRDGRP